MTFSFLPSTDLFNRTGAKAAIISEEPSFVPKRIVPEPISRYEKTHCICLLPLLFFCRLPASVFVADEMNSLTSRCVWCFVTSPFKSHLRSSVKLNLVINFSRNALIFTKKKDDFIKITQLIRKDKLHYPHYYQKWDFHSSTNCIEVYLPKPLKNQRGLVPLPNNEILVQYVQYMWYFFQN